MKLKKIVLPRTYEDPFGNYPEMKGKPKLSYSQITSFKDDKYKGQYFYNYFLGLKDDGNIFSRFGNKCGEYWEKLETSDLGENDIKILEKLPRPETAKYETEILVDRGFYCIQGFIDQEDEFEKGKLVITDLKTGNHKDKPKFYASEKYQQTTLYTHCRENEGYEVTKSQVILLERKGNGSEKHPLRLSGESLIIPTEYSKDRAERFLKECDKIAVEISDYFGTYNKFLNDGVSEM